MRVTNSMLTDLVQRNINQSLSVLQKLQMRLATGKALLEASDEPVGASLAVGLRAAIAAREQLHRNGDSARDRLSAAEKALDNIQPLLVDVRGLAVKGADDTGGAEQRSILADQVNQFLEALLDLSMSRFGDDYLFGGTEVTTAPYTATRTAGEISAVAANPKGISGQQLREILSGVTIAANVTGPEVFAGSVDLFQTLITLRDALSANNTPAISATLTSLDAGIGQVSAATGSIGGRIQRLDAAQDILTADLMRVKELLSRIEDADIAETTLDFQRQQNLFEASLQAGARLIQPSLLDFLR